MIVELMSEIASRKVRTEADRIAGSTSGRVMRKIVFSRPAPRMAAASSISLETSSSAAVVKTKT